MKLPNSYGSVYKLSGNRRKPWRAIVTTGWTLDPETGKSKQVRKTVGYYATRQEALTALSDYNKNPFNLDLSNITLAEVYEKWSAEKYPTLSQSASRSYKTAYKLFKPIENRRMCDIRLDDLQFIVDNSGKNEPPLTIFKLLCNALFEYSIVHDYIPPTANKVKYLNVKKGNPNAHDKKPFTAKEIETIWQHAQLNDYCNVILMLIYSGVRISELLDLKKEDVNLSEKWFNVKVSKTKSGVRKIPIADKIYPFFEYWYNKNDSEYLITTPDGQHLNYNNYYTNYWPSYMKQMNMKHTVHETRHTFVTLLAEAGVDERTIRKLAGHKGQSVTEVVYTHLEIETLREAINKI